MCKKWKPIAISSYLIWRAIHSHCFLLWKPLICFAKWPACHDNNIFCAPQNYSNAKIQCHKNYIWVDRSMTPLLTVDPHFPLNLEDCFDCWEDYSAGIPVGNVSKLVRVVALIEELPMSSMTMLTKLFRYFLLWFSFFWPTMMHWIRHRFLIGPFRPFIGFNTISSLDPVIK